MNGKIHGICTMMIRIIENIQKTTVFGGKLLALALTLAALTSCGKAAPAGPEFPPAEEAVAAALDQAGLGWTLAEEGAQSWGEGHILYPFSVGEKVGADGAYLNCALAEDGGRILMVGAWSQCREKPVFRWEDWEAPLRLAETLYGISGEEGLYQTFSDQGTPEPEIPLAGPDVPTGLETLQWEAELPAGYARFSWSITAGESTHSFPEPEIHNWRVSGDLSLFESKAAWEVWLNS